MLLIVTVLFQLSTWRNNLGIAFFNLLSKLWSWNHDLLLLGRELIIYLIYLSYLSYRGFTQLEKKMLKYLINLPNFVRTIWEKNILLMEISKQLVPNYWSWLFLVDIGFTNLPYWWYFGWNFFPLTAFGIVSMFEHHCKEHNLIVHGSKIIRATENLHICKLLVQCNVASYIESETSINAIWYFEHYYIYIYMSRLSWNYLDFCPISMFLPQYYTYRDHAFSILLSCCYWCLKAVFTLGTTNMSLSALPNANLQ